MKDGSPCRTFRKPEGQARRKQTEAPWQNANKPPPEPLRVPAPFKRRPWDLAKDEFGANELISLGCEYTAAAHRERPVQGATS